MNSHSHYRPANIALAVACILYTAIWWIGISHEQAYWYAPLYWVTQSALIGGVADWFAVTALFRRPLGIAFHTELIPRNKQKLVDKLVILIEAKLLSREKLEEHVQKISFVEYLNRIVQSENGKALLSQLIMEWLNTYKDETKRLRLMDQISNVALHMAKRINFADALRRTGISALDSAEGKLLIISALYSVEKAAAEPSVCRELQDLIDKKIDQKTSGVTWLFLQALSLFDLVNTKEMASVLQQETVELIHSCQNPDSEGYRRIMEVLRNGLDSLNDDEAEVETLQAVYVDWLTSIPWAKSMERFVWPNLSDQIIGNGKNPSEAAVVLTDKLIGEWNFYSKEPEFCNALEQILRQVTFSLLDRFHPAIGSIVANVLNSFSTERFNQFVEDKVGDDLGWIRINGVVLGAILGFVLWSFLYFIYDPILANVFHMG